MELGVDLGHFSSEMGEQLASRAHSQRVGLGQLEAVELALAQLGVCVFLPVSSAMVDVQRLRGRFSESDKSRVLRAELARFRTIWRVLERLDRGRSITPAPSGAISGRFGPHRAVFERAQGEG